MAGYPKEFPGTAGIQIGVIAGGDINDPASDHSCNQKVYSPLEHSPDGVKLEHLAFSPLSHSPTNMSQQSFPGVMDPGTLVYVLKTTGQNQVTILGQANDFNNANKNRTPGNMDLMSNPIIMELLNRTIGVLIPPDIEETVVKGAKVKVPKEKGVEHSHNLLQGLPTHGAMFQLAGYRLPQVKNIPTAMQQFNALLTEDDLSNLPGEIMSLGKMFQGLLTSQNPASAALSAASNIIGDATGQTLDSIVGGAINDAANIAADTVAGAIGGVAGDIAGDIVGDVVGEVLTMSAAEMLSQIDLKPNPDSDIPMERILAKLPDPMLADALVNIAILTQGGESSGTGSFVTSHRCHLETLVKNAEEMLSQVTSVSDIMNVLQDLIGNEEHYGQDLLEPIVYTIDTAFGKAEKYLFANGFIDIVVDPDQANADNAFSNSITSGVTTYGAPPPKNSGPSGGGAPSASGQNMFGDMGGKIMDMMKRVSPEAEQKQKEVIDLVNTSDAAMKLHKIVEAFINGKNPIDPTLFT